MAEEQKEYADEHIWNKEEPQPIAVPLLGAHIHHNADVDQDDYNFVGRDGLINELLSVLEQTKNTRGCYLIAGLRGSGKTSLINKVLSLHAGKSTHPTWLTSNLVDSWSQPFHLFTLMWRGRRKIIKNLDSTQSNTYTYVQSLRHAIKSSWPLVQQLFRQIRNSRPQILKMIFNLEIVRSFNPIVDVRVNLGHEKPLGSREVLLNTATLLYHKLRRQTGTLISRWCLFFALVVCPSLFVATIATNFLDTQTVEQLIQLIEKLNPVLGQSSNNSKAQLSKNSTGAVVQGQSAPPNSNPPPGAQQTKNPQSGSSAQPWNPYVDAMMFTGVWFITFSILRYIWTRHLPTYDRILHRLKILSERMAFSNEYTTEMGRSEFKISRKKLSPPIDARQIEMELMDILEDCRHTHPLFVRPDVVFVFDELDKIAPDNSSEDIGPADSHSVERDLYQRKQKVDQLLGALKSFITHAKARFFFIGGRDMLDSYQAERGSTNSLYESLFNRTFEVPSLLSDHSNHNPLRPHSMIEVFVCRKLMEYQTAMYLWLLHAYRSQDKDPCWEDDLRRKLMYSPFRLGTYYHYLSLVPGMKGIEARRIVLGLRHFIQFLTLHSWGNPKRLVSLFEHFTKPIADVDWRQHKQVLQIAGMNSSYAMALQFGLIDQQRIILASNLYTQLYHVLGRQLSRSSDKLIVSTLAALQHILKFHRYPFSRYHLERMAETLNVYRPTELNNMIDALLTKVLRPQLRLIRNSHYRYRFNSEFEEEMRYISRVSDIESAAFNFSLDSSAAVKAHFLDQLREMESVDKKSTNESAVAISELCLVLGDLSSQEQAEGRALSYYQKAVDVIDRCPENQRTRFAHIYVEALLRLGETYERRQRYERAASVYLHARNTVLQLKKSQDRSLQQALSRDDSKWDVFRQPFWAYWYLQLKRSPMPSVRDLPPRFEYPFSGGTDFVNHYKAGQLAFYYGDHLCAAKSFHSAITANPLTNDQTERTAYRGAYAYLSLGETLLIGMTRDILKVLSAKEDIDPSNYVLLEESINNISKTYEQKLACVTQAGNLKSLVRTFENHREGFFHEIDTLTTSPDCLNTINIVTIFGMMAKAAKLLANHGLYYHAAVANVKIMSIWGLFSEIAFMLSNLTPLTNVETNRFQSALNNTVRNSNKWLSEVRNNAVENITKMNVGGYARFQERWRKRDISCFFGDQPKNHSVVRFISRQLCDEWQRLLGQIGGETNAATLKKEFEFPVDGPLDLIQPLELLLSENQNPEDSIHVNEPSFLQRSIPGQELIHLSIWQHMSKLGSYQIKPPIVSIPHNSMTPHSVRSLTFAHWLAGRRYLYWDVFKFLKDSSKSNEIYDAAAAAIHNFYLASYYIRQLSGNDQDVMFPSPSMVLFDLWYLLYTLVNHEKNVSKSNYEKAAIEVTKALSSSKLRRHGSPANFYDLENVKLRTITALLDTEQLSDISNRARSDVIKTRYYLADDYEDPRFHLDWTLLQMYGPLARILRNYIECASHNLRQ